MADGEIYGLTEAGFKLKRLRDILESVKNKMEQVTDPETGYHLEINFEENDPFIQFINLVCDELATIWELLNAAYDQFDPLKVTGPMLSSLVQLNGITRKAGSHSVVYVRFYGIQGTIVPIGTRVSNPDKNIIWQVVVQNEASTSADETARTINQQDGQSFYCNLKCESVNNGAFTADPDTITNLIDNFDGISSVVNTTAAVPGLSDETDIALRRRRAKVTETPSQGMAESIYAGIMGLQNVNYCKIFTNRTMQENSLGIPAKSIAVVVQVEDEHESDIVLKKKIAETIFLRSGLGEEYYAPEGIGQVISYTDSFNQATDIKFVYPQKVPIFVKVVVTDLEGSPKISDIQEITSKIRNNIIKYAKDGPSGIGIVTQQDVFDEFGFPPSENIDRVRLYTPINAVPGIKVVDLQIGLDDSNYSNNDINIEWWQVGKFTEDNIVVEYNGTAY